MVILNNSKQKTKIAIITIMVITTANGNTNGVAHNMVTTMRLMVANANDNTHGDDNANQTRQQ